MLVESFIISNVIFSLRAIFTTLYIVKSSGKQDHCDLRHNDEHWSELIITCSFIDITNFTCVFDIAWLVMQKIVRNFLKIYPGYLLEIGWAGLVETSCTALDT